MQFIALEIEPVHVTPTEATHWGLYGRKSDGTVMHIADRRTQAEAEALRAALDCYAVTRAPAPVWATYGDDYQFLGSYDYRGNEASEMPPGVYDLYFHEMLDGTKVLYIQFGSEKHDRCTVSSMEILVSLEADHPLRQAFHLATAAALAVKEQSS